MARKREKYAPTFSLRLSEEERKKLDEMAGDMPLGFYIRSRLFDTPSPRRYAPAKRKQADQVMLEKIWVELRRQYISSNLNRIMRAIEEHDLEVPADLEMELRILRSDLRLLRRDILKALGRDPPEGQWGGKR